MEYKIALDEEYKYKNNMILDHFGINHQYKKLIEELSELNNSLGEYFNKFEEYSNVAFVDKHFEEANDFLSEIADCFVISEQLCENSFTNHLISLFMDHWNVWWTNKYLDSDYTDKFLTEVINKIESIMKFKIDRTIERYNIKKEENGCQKI